MDAQTIWILERNTWDRVAQHHHAAALMWFDVRHDIETHHRWHSAHHATNHFDCWLRFSTHWRLYKEAVHMRALAEGMVSDG